MTRRRLVSVDDAETPDLPDANVETVEYYEDHEGAGWSDDYEEPPTERRLSWILPALAVCAILGWTGFFGWAYRNEMLSGASPQQWIDWIAAWSMPVILVIGLWLLAMRSSRREATRFSDAASALSRESALLETRLSVVNRELSLAREFIAAQSRDLESLGRLATERLSTNADRLQTLIRDNSAQIETIGGVSETAVANMETLRDRLPVVTNAARDMSNQIGSAGDVAQAQIEQMVVGFERLNQFGEVGERHVNAVNQAVTDTLEGFDRQVATLAEVTQARFGKLRDISTAFRADLEQSEGLAIEALRERADALSAEIGARNTAQREEEDRAIAAMRERIAMLNDEGERMLASVGDGRESIENAWHDAIAALEARMTEAISHVSELDEQALGAARARLDALSQEAARVDERTRHSLAVFDDEIERRRSDLSAREAAEIAALQERINAFDETVNERQEAQVSHLNGLAEQAETLADRVSNLDRALLQLSSQSDDTGTALGEAADGLAERISQSRAVLEESRGTIAGLTDDSVRLLEIIRSGADHTGGALAESIENAEKRLVTFGEEATRLQSLMEDAEARSAAVVEHVENAREIGGNSLENLVAMQERLADLAEQSEGLVDRTGSELRDAIEQLNAASGEAFEALRNGQQDIVDDIADRIARDSKERIAESIRADAAAVIAELEQAVANATRSGEEGSASLRRQLAQIDELAGNLEARVDYARERAEEKVDSDFARRMALITEALNSSSIDISKAFDNEVSDTQWANYLRGDRGIFTRRAVRLLNRQDQRAVAEIYGDDSEFRETVNRYIHDFEAMLREVLSTRDGHAMAVALLSSEIGKLYVALAQAIERLRG